VGRILTSRQLCRAGACQQQVRRFRRMFGTQVEVTPELAASAASEYDWVWAAENLLNATAWKAYEEARATAWQAYDEARATAWKAYEEARATARKAYEEARATAWANAYIADE